MSLARPLHVFTGYGIEIEQMIVARDTLSPMPAADRLLQRVAGVPANEVERGMLAWSNEMTLHVIEIKNPRPVSVFEVLPAAFQEEIRFINRTLESFDARLMPTAMHPWMNPRGETRIWPHGNTEIYQAYQRIFDCNTHGWANLQSMHVNLPFSGDREFARLHAAIRLLLPVLPALAASSPLAEGRHAGFAGFRMEAYRRNAERIPSITGSVVPETVASRAEYEERILAPMYRDIREFDRRGVLQREWLNSRGAIARFERNAIEIRVIDTQECPHADLSVAAAVIGTVKNLYREDAAALAEQQAIDTNALASLFLSCIRDAEQAVLNHAEYLRLLGFPGDRCTAGELWRHLIGLLPEVEDRPGFWRKPLNLILEHGPLARRIERAVGADLSPARLREVYSQLCDCLDSGQMFIPS